MKMGRRPTPPACVLQASLGTSVRLTWTTASRTPAPMGAPARTMGPDTPVPAPEESRGRCVTARHSPVSMVPARTGAHVLVSPLGASTAAAGQASLGRAAPSTRPRAPGYQTAAAAAATLSSTITCPRTSSIGWHAPPRGSSSGSP